MSWDTSFFKELEETTSNLVLSKVSGASKSIATLFPVKAAIE